MLKIGALSFSNALPFFLPLSEKKIACVDELIFGSPTEINTLLEQGKIDIGLISSASFIANRDRYILLSNLGIGATRYIMNVCLYTHYDIEALDNKVIAIESERTTSAMLLKVLCIHYWKVQPKFVVLASEKPDETLLQKYDAVLVIGDTCLTMKKPKATTVVDLAHAWYEYTGKPFVFSVFATKTDSWIQEPEQVSEFHQKLTLSYEYSQKHFDMILQKAKSTTKLSTAKLAKYYKTHDYYLETEHFQGLEHFAKLYNKNP